MASHTNENLHYDISELVRMDMRVELPPPIVAEILSSPPFVTIPGVINVRYISSTATALNIRQGFAYRSGPPTKITGSGIRKLVEDVGVKTIFDLRNSSEREKFPWPEILGAETVWLAYAATPERADLDVFAKDDAGKDRSGVLAALILQLVGVPRDLIAHDYLLTRVGTEPARQSLFSSLQAGVKERGSDAISVSPRLLALMSVKDTAITTFVESIESRFKGGIVGYLKTDLGFTVEDIEMMLVNLAPVQ
ncbi:hypothetical protein VE02_07605 [Pseudogymnoascus sp. 03VT05]|nr:hypothetical protein VE02_07605 [Pseudogymnoascus sp. 03VT05]